MYVSYKDTTPESVSYKDIRVFTLWSVSYMYKDISREPVSYKDTPHESVSYKDTTPESLKIHAVNLYPTKIQPLNLYLSKMYIPCDLYPTIYIYIYIILGYQGAGHLNPYSRCVLQVYHC